MREPRNPFRLRAAENIEADATFLRLFGPGMLDVLPIDGQLWGKVQIIRSAPGGGKTSLLRLFTPSALLNLYALRTRDEYKELFQKMVALGAIGDAGPKLLGVMLSCARNYAALSDMNFDKARKERILFSLLNARITLATLRNALVLRKLKFPEDLNRLTVRVDGAEGTFGNLSFPCNGRVLYDWALNLEIKVCGAIDSLGPVPLEQLPGHDALDSLALLQPQNLVIDGQPVAERALLMLDDVHKLAVAQREKVLEAIIDYRSSASIWIAERFEALSTSELLSSGSTQGRDYESVILLENAFQQGKRFENLVSNIADRRARSAVEVEIASFIACLEPNLDGVEWQSKLAEVLSAVRGKVIKSAQAKPVFGEWISAREKMSGTLFEKVLSWRTLGILIQREIRKTQTTFDFELDVEALEDKDDSAVNVAAGLFLAKEFDLPYYYGHNKLASLASRNIEQFLSIAENDFEEIVSAALLRKEAMLSARDQHNIVLRRADQRWEEIPRQVRNGREARKFLEAVGTFAASVTYQPTAPYSPGVTGIAISMSDREKLRDAGYLKKNEKHARLAVVIASLIAHNLLEPILDYRCKGTNWMVLNLNRLLCARFRLPLQYGGFKEKTLDELVTWSETGFVPPKEKPASLWN